MTAGAMSDSQIAGPAWAERFGQIGKVEAPGSGHLPAFRRERVECGQSPKSSILPPVVAIATQEFLGEPGEVETPNSCVNRTEKLHGFSPAIVGS